MTALSTVFRMCSYMKKTHLRLNIHNKGINNILSSGIIVYSRIDDMYVIVRGWVKLLAGSQLYLLDMDRHIQ